MGLFRIYRKISIDLFGNPSVFWHGGLGFPIFFGCISLRTDKFPIPTWFITPLRLEFYFTEMGLIFLNNFISIDVLDFFHSINILMTCHLILIMFMLMLWVAFLCSQLEILEKLGLYYFNYLTIHLNALTQIKNPFSFSLLFPIQIKPHFKFLHILLKK